MLLVHKRNLDLPHNLVLEIFPVAFSTVVRLAGANRRHTYFIFSGLYRVKAPGCSQLGAFL